MILDCVLLILLSAMLVLRLAIFPLNFICRLKKKTEPPLAVPIPSLLLSPPHLVSAYLNSLRVRVYFCEIILNQYNCIWHFLTTCSVWRATAHLRQ